MEDSTIWIIGRYYNEYDKNIICGVIIPTGDEIRSKKLSIEGLKDKIQYVSKSEIEKKLGSSLLDTNIVQISLNKVIGTTQTAINIDISCSLDELIENQIYSNIFNAYNSKRFIGKYRDDKGDLIYIFSISNQENYNDSSIYYDKNIIRLNELPFLRNNPILDDYFIATQEENMNIIDNYVASHLMVHRWKNRLFNVEKYKTIWILDAYNTEENKGYCIIPTDEEIQRKIVINKDKNRVRIINRYNPKNCIIIHDHGIDFTAVKNEKLYIPYYTLRKFTNEISILDVNENEVSWTIDAPRYTENNITFYTNDSDILSNLLRLPILSKNGENKPSLTCLQSTQEVGAILKIIPQHLEMHILHSIRDYALDLINKKHPHLATDNSQPE